MNFHASTSDAALVQRTWQHGAHCRHLRGGESTQQLHLHGEDSELRELLDAEEVLVMGEVGDSVDVHHDRVDFLTVQLLQGLRVAVRLAVLRQVQVAARRSGRACTSSRCGDGPAAAAVWACDIPLLRSRPPSKTLRHSAQFCQKTWGDAADAEHKRQQAV